MFIRLLRNLRQGRPCLQRSTECGLMTNYMVEPRHLRRLSGKSLYVRNVTFKATSVSSKYIGRGEWNVAFKYCPKSLVSNSDCSNSVRGFKLSARRDVNPLVWLIVRPLFKVAAALTGRGFRKWWKDLPPDKKKYFLSLLKQNRVRIWAVVTLFGCFMYYYYESHLEETPITKRKRFIAFDAEQFKLIGENEFKQVKSMYENEFLSTNHPYTKRVASVVYRLLEANKDLEEVKNKTWTIAVVDSSMENAFALPNGEIFVFSGMLKLCSNDNQLGAVLAHEMSHSILGHGAENFSLAHLMDCFFIVVIAAVWAILPSDYLAVFTHWLIKQSADIVLRLPYSRKIEMEADEVGLQLAAKSCFDVRESSAFWAKMAIVHLKKDIPQIEFLSTHPTHENRSQYLDTLMDQALKLRSDCGCPALKTKDPRLEVERLAGMLEDERKRYKTANQVVVLVPSIPGG